MQVLVIGGIGAYFILQLAIAFWASRHIKSEGDFLVAGRTLGLGLVAVSLFATWFGAETVMGSSAMVAEQGLSGARADPFGYALTLLGMGLLLAYQLRKRNYLTIGDFLKDRFDTRVEFLGCLILIPSMVTWAGAQMLAFGTILEAITGIGLGLGIIFATILVITYSSLGGLLGDVVTDFVQGIVMVVGIVIMFVMVAVMSGGIGPMVSGFEPAQLSLIPDGESGWARFEIWAIPIMGSLVSQVALARVLAARTAEIARRACFLAFGIYLTVGVLPVMIALAAPHLGIAMDEGDGFLPALAEEILPTWLYVVFMGALISAILSTVDSTLLTISALTSHNIIQPMLGTKSESAKVTLNRLLVIGAGLLAYMVAVMGDRILQLVIFADSIGSAGLVVLVLVGLYSRIGGPVTALATLIVGMAGPFILGQVTSVEAPWMTTLGICLVVYLVAGTIESRGRKPATI